MKQSHRFFGLTSILLLTFSAFVACGGLDGRKITRDRSDYSPGGDTGTDPIGSGGTDAQAGEPAVNPFGGAFDNGGAPMVVDGPPTVTKVDPEDMATDVEIDADVSFLFSEAVTASTVSTDSIKLLDGADEVAGKVTATTDQVATFDPTRRLALATTYTASVSTAITDTTGQGLASAFTSTFTTRDGVWEADIPILDDAASWYTYASSQVGVDALGNTLVLYPLSTGLWARWYRITSGWQAAELVTPAVTTFSAYASAVSAQGNAVVTWVEYDAMTNLPNVMSRRFIGGSWNPMNEVVSKTTDTYSAQVAVGGEQFVVWWVDRVTPSSTYIYASATTPDAAWPANATYLYYVDATTTYIGASSLAMDSVGNGMLVLNVVASTGTIGSLYFAKFIGATQDWESPAPIADAAGVAPYQPPLVALDNKGAAMVAWANGDASGDLMASRYTAAKGFSTAVPVDDVASTASVGKKGLATDGTDFMVAWGQTVGSTLNIYGSHYATADATWSAPKLLTNGASAGGLPITLADSHGNFAALWPNGSEFGAARWLATEAAWSDAVSISAGRNFDAGLFDAASSANGVMALITQDYGDYTVEHPGQPYLNLFH